MISLCIPTFERFQMTIECFEQILLDDRISEVVIVDDASTDGSYIKLCNYFKDEPKVKLYLNHDNRDCYRNKKTAIELAKNHWCILADSDNVFGVDYLDAVCDYIWNDKCFHQPEFAYPHFDFRKYAGLMITSSNVADYIDDASFSTMLNAQNMFINRAEYLKVWDGSIDPVTSDSLYFAYCWLKSGRSIYVTPNMQYEHRVHNGSHYQNNVHRTPKGFHEEILDKLKQLH